ncbi:MAG: methionine--tRNA ligase [Planctomycetes bacterium]|nr:methionine--tRNA ligase [Planctomycetota bacterium]
MRYYLTTAIDYVNSRPHLGTAYEKITADVIARYQRGCGNEVRFLMGNDEHSQKVAAAGRKEGLTPLEWCDRMEGVFRSAWSALEIQPDVFIRTSEPRHREAVQALAQRIKDAGDFYEGEYEGWYCVGCEAFKRDEDLKDGLCPDHANRKPEWLKEKNWFFRLSRWCEPLKAHFAANPSFVLPESRRNELLALLDRGLEDISVSRTGTDWGIPFPFDERVVVYVWFDALINYITATGWPQDTASSAHWWPADLHLVGKDITRFHGVVWPAMLLSAGLPVPRKVFGHGFVNMSGGRMSKDAGRVTDPLELANTYGVAALRYYLCAEANFGQDLEFSEERLLARANSDLANGLGNLAARTAGMLTRWREGRVAAAPQSSALLARADAAVDTYQRCMEVLDLRGALAAATQIVTEANAHVDRTQPFAMAKDPARTAELDGVLAELVNSLLLACRLHHPFMPAKMEQLHLELTGTALDLTSSISGAKGARVLPGTILVKGAALFPRIETAKT